MQQFLSGFGLLTFLLICFALSEKRSAISWKTVGVGVLGQLLIGAFILKTSLGLSLFSGAKEAATAILNFTQEGSLFIFGNLSKFEEVGFVLATMVLPTIIFTGALMSILYHLGVMQRFVQGMAWLMVRFMSTSGSESLAAAANVFAGQTEAPLVIRPYIEKMTRSELMCLMTGGFSTVAGGVLAAYVGMGIDAGHLLAASVISAPAALVCAKLLVPETEESLTSGVVKLDVKKETVNIVDAAAVGASEGLKLSLNVLAMLLSFIALIAMLNSFLGLVGGWVGFPELSFELISSYLFFPFAFLMGVPVEECLPMGQLLGKKLIVNEFVAYLDLKEMISSGVLSERSTIIATYALCGFSNFSSVAIQLGGIGPLAPSRTKDIARLGMKALLGGTVACMMTATIAGILLS